MSDMSSLAEAKEVRNGKGLRQPARELILSQLPGFKSRREHLEKKKGRGLWEQGGA